MRLPTNNKVTLPYGATSYPYSKLKPHAGVDYSFKPNPYVYSPEDGTVTRAGNLGTCGLSVDLVKGNRKYRFCHMKKLFVKKNQKIKEGDKVGRIGATGYAFGEHLHLVMWVNNKRVDPDKTIRKGTMYKGKSAKYWYDQFVKERAKARARGGIINRIRKALPSGWFKK